MLTGYFAKISRNIVNTPYYNNATLLRAWMGLVLSVRFTPTVIDGIEVGINEVLVTKDGIAELFGVPKSRAYYVLKKMEHDGLVTWLNIRNKYTLITLKEENFASLINRRIERPDGRKNSISIEQANNMSIEEELLPEECTVTASSMYDEDNDECDYDECDYGEQDYDEDDCREDDYGSEHKHDTAGSTKNYGFSYVYILSDEEFISAYGYVPDTDAEKRRLSEKFYADFLVDYEKFCREQEDEYSSNKKNTGTYKKNYSRRDDYKRSTPSRSAYSGDNAYKVRSAWGTNYCDRTDNYSEEKNRYQVKSVPSAKSFAEAESAPETKSVPGTDSLYGAYNYYEAKPVSEKKPPTEKKMKFGEYNNVLLTRDEYNDLNMKFMKARLFIDELSADMARNHKKYESHYSELLSRHSDEMIKSE